MKWLSPNGAVQHSADHRYAVVQATEGNWIAYALGPTTGQELGLAGTDGKAREICEGHEERSARKRA